MKETFSGLLRCFDIGLVGSAIAQMFGGWSGSMTTLLILMAIDWATGLIVAGVFHTSDKTETGGLSSAVGAKGLAKKGMILVFILIANRVDLMLGTTYIRDAVCIAYIVNELISVIENADLMGVPVPEILVNAIDALKSKKSGEK